MVTTLSERLADGSVGVRLAFPQNFEVYEESETSLVLVDGDQSTLWQCTISPFRLDMSPNHRDQLLIEVRDSARTRFNKEWDERRANGEVQPGTVCRTEDETWTPVIEAAAIDIGAPALQVLHRMSYEPGMEHVAGRLLIPVKDGLVEIACNATDSTTGVRESVLVTQRELQEHPGQEFFDDSIHDTKFPEHALSRGRKGLEWLRAESGITVVEPAEVPESGELMLEESQCRLVPPTGFLRLPAAALGMSETMTNFSRVSLSIIEMQPTLLSVWFLSDEYVTPGDSKALVALAKSTAKGWTNEGAKGVKVQTQILEPQGGMSAEVECTVAFVVQGRKVQDHQRWIVNANGSVWRLSIGSDSGSQSAGPLAAARASFRPSDTAKPPPKKKRRWWQLG